MRIVFENKIIKTDELVFDENVGGLGMIYYQRLQKYGNSIAQIEEESEKSDTFSSLRQKSVRTAIQMRQRGIEKGDFIALCSDHHLNACVPIIAAHFLGAIPFAFDPSHFVSDCINILNIVQPKITFCVDKAKTLLEEAYKKTNVKNDIIVFGKDFEINFLSPQIAEDQFIPIHVNDLHETAILYFSSGTTGLPKAICVSHYTMMTLVGALVNDPDRDRLFKAQYPVFIHFTNWYWASSGFFLFTYTIKGGCRILSNCYEPDRLWKLIEKYKINGVFLSPLRTIEFCNSDKPENVDISSWEILFHGGSNLSKQHILELRQKLPSIRVIQGYGQTETGLLLHFGNVYDEQIMRHFNEKPGCLGLPVRGVCYKVVDITSEEILGANQPGELRVKGKQIMKSYYKKDSSSCFDKDGWYKTGDILYYDEDFCFYFVERLSETLKCRDWLVFPVQVENILIKHPAVQHAVVIGKPHEKEGYQLMGVVVLREKTESITEMELMKFVNERVNDTQRLKAGIIFLKSLPLTTTGKISKKLVRQMVLEGV